VRTFLSELNDNLAWSNVTLTGVAGVTVDGTLQRNGYGSLKYNLYFTGITAAVNSIASIATHNLSLTGYPRVLPAVILSSGGSIIGSCSIIINTNGTVFVATDNTAITPTNTIRLGNAA
jgi:hypothetical protein